MKNILSQIPNVIIGILGFLPKKKEDPGGKSKQEARPGNTARQAQSSTSANKNSRDKKENSAETETVKQAEPEKGRNARSHAEETALQALPEKEDQQIVKEHREDRSSNGRRANTRKETAKSERESTKPIPEVYRYQRRSETEKDNRQEAKTEKDKQRAVGRKRLDNKEKSLSGATSAPAVAPRKESDARNKGTNKSRLEWVQEIEDIARDQSMTESLRVEDLLPEVIPGNKNLIYKLRQNGVIDFAEIRDATDKKLTKAYLKGLNKSELERLSSALREKKSITQAQTNKETEERSEANRHSYTHHVASKIEPEDSFNQHKPIIRNDSSESLEFDRVTRFAYLEEDSESIYRVRVDLNGKTIIINKEHPYGNRLHKIIMNKEESREYRDIPRQILLGASEESFWGHFKNDKEGYKRVQMMITTILTNIITENEQ